MGKNLDCQRTSQRRSALRQVAVRVLVRFDHVACFIVNANYTVVSAAVEFRIVGVGYTLPFTFVPESRPNSEFG